MSESKALMLAQPRDITDETWNRAFGIAEKIAAMYNRRPAEMAMAMARGWELGIPLTAAAEMVYIVSTKNGLHTALATQLMNGLVQRSGLLKTMRFKRLEDNQHNCTGYEVYMERTNGLSYTGAFTKDDAEKAGLLKKDNWQTYDDDMYFNRAFAKVARRVLPDVLLGMYTPEELGVHVEEGIAVTPLATSTVIEGEYTEPTVDQETNTTQPAQEAKSVLPTTLAELLKAGYDPNAIMAANNGAIPTTPEDVARVYKTLTEEVKDAAQ